MKERSTETNLSSQHTTPQLPPRTFWKKLLPVAFLPPILLLLYVVVRDSFGTSDEPKIVAEGRTRTIQLDVLNGSGQPKLAQRLTDYLRARGFDVVEMGNYKTSDVEATMVLDRAGNLEAAKQVAAAIGVPEEQVQQQIDKSVYLDVSVVIGKDFQRLKALQ